MHASIEPTADSQRLFALGRRVLAPHIQLPLRDDRRLGRRRAGRRTLRSRPDPALRHLPDEDDFEKIRRQIRGGPIDMRLGSAAEGSFLIQYKVDGVDCQLGCSTVAQWETDIAEALSGKDPGGPIHKALYGTLSSVAVHGGDLLRKWQQQLETYPEALRVAMIRHHLRFFRLWRVMDRMLPRDSTLWQKQAMLESSFNVLGVLAGVNRKYFTSFQFKRMRLFIDSLTFAPTGLADRLERIWTQNPRAAAAVLREVIAETVGIVESHVRQVDTSAVRKIL